MSGDDNPSRKLIIPKGVLESGNNVIEIPESCEDSRVLIAKLQAKYGKPPRYYPPKTNPDNKFERRINDQCVALGMPGLSPLREEPRRYRTSLSQYGPPKSPEYVSHEPSYFGTDTTHFSEEVSGKFDYCPSSTPKRARPQTCTQFPSPKLSPIRMGRDIFATEPSVYNQYYTPPPRARAPSPSPIRSSPSRSSSRRHSSSGRHKSHSHSSYAGSSCSIGDISSLLDNSRGHRRSMNWTPDSARGLSGFNPLATPVTPVPPELDTSVLDESLHELEDIELQELSLIRDKMRRFQSARKELVLSIFSLQEAQPT